MKLKHSTFFHIVIVYFTNVKSLLFYLLLLFFQFLDTWNSFSITGSNIHVLITYSGWVMFIFFTSANSSQHFLLRHSLICGDLILTDTEICMDDNLPNNLGVLLSFSDIMDYLCKPKWFTNCCFSLFLFAFSSNCYLYNKEPGPPTAKLALQYLIIWSVVK